MKDEVDIHRPGRGGYRGGGRPKKDPEEVKNNKRCVVLSIGGPAEKKAIISEKIEEITKIYGLTKSKALGQFFLDLDLDKLRVEVENSKTKD